MEVDALQVPVLLLHGSHDRLHDPEGSPALAARIGSDCTMRICDGLYHEIHDEPERERVLEDLIGWLDTHTG